MQTIPNQSNIFHGCLIKICIKTDAQKNFTNFNALFGNKKEEFSKLLYNSFCTYYKLRINIIFFIIYTKKVHNLLKNQGHIHKFSFMVDGIY